MKLNRVKMFARRISATERLVRSAPAFASPRERRSATSALLSPAGGVSATGAAGVGGVEAAASPMPSHRVAGQGQRNGRLPAASTASPPPALRLTVPQAPSIRAGPTSIVNGDFAAIVILLTCLETSASRRLSR